MTDKIRADLTNFYKVTELVKCSEKLTEAYEAIRTAERALEEARSKLLSAEEGTEEFTEEFFKAYQSLSDVRGFLMQQKNKHVDRRLRNVAFEVEMALGVDKL